MAKSTQKAFEFKVRTKGLSNHDFDQWFESEDFEKIEFTGATEYLTLSFGGSPIVFKIVRREKFDTYCKIAELGGLIVFEVSLQGNRVLYEGYCPLLLFGFWNKKVAFEKTPSSITKYLGEGYEIMEEFETFLAGSDKSR